MAARPGKTLTARHEKATYLRNAGNKKDQITTTLLSCPQRVGAPRGEGELLPEQTIVKGMTGRVITNVGEEMVEFEAGQLSKIAGVPASTVRKIDGMAGGEKKRRARRKAIREAVQYLKLPKRLHEGMLASEKMKAYDEGKIPYLLFRSGHIVTCTENGWQNSASWYLYITKLVNPAVKKRRQALDAFMEKHLATTSASVAEMTADTKRDAASFIASVNMTAEKSAVGGRKANALPPNSPSPACPTMSNAESALRQRFALPGADASAMQCAGCKNGWASQTDHMGIGGCLSPVEHADADAEKAANDDAGKAADAAAEKAADAAAEKAANADAGKAADLGSL